MIGAIIGSSVVLLMAIIGTTWRLASLIGKMDVRISVIETTLTEREKWRSRSQ